MHNFDQKKFPLIRTRPILLFLTLPYKSGVRFAKLTSCFKSNLNLTIGNTLVHYQRPGKFRGSTTFYFHAVVDANKKIFTSIMF